MAAGQQLRGLVGQGVSAKKKRPNFSVGGTGPVYNFPLAESGAYTFTVPTSGRWMFVGWGPGGLGSSGSKGGSSGAYVEVTRFLARGQTVSLSVNFNADTVITLPDGTIAIAGKSAPGGGGAPGIASGGDVNINGTSSAVSGSGSPGGGTGGGPGGTPTGGNIGGAGAPANLPFRGGKGGGSLSIAGHGGGGVDVGQPGQGLALAVFIPR